MPLIERCQRPRWHVRVILKQPEHETVVNLLAFHHRKRTTLACLILLAIILWNPCAAFAAEFAGKVIGVIDGDSLRVLHNGRAEEVRLNAIDCPEKGQAYGKKAKQATSELAFGQEVTVQTTGKDRYGRTLATVILTDGKNLNHELVREGWCWWFRKYAPLDTAVEALEQSAREAKKGLWIDPAPIPPWVYRKARRGERLDRLDLAPFEADAQGALSARAPPRLGALSSEASLESPAPIIGNRRSRIYHRPDCPNYSQIAPRNRIEFTTAADAEAAGYRAAKNCP